ncbi:hypothetical protein EI94DRAFT_1337031 [Lactarius quietus]|nr:hypothetical protein EI94DRAFT_1337031 [Lactarius quietus]
MAHHPYHGSLATSNNPSPIHYSLPFPRVEDGPLSNTAEFPSYLSSGLFLDHPYIAGASFTEGPSPSSPSRDVDDLRLPGSSPEFPLSADYQQVSTSEPTSLPSFYVDPISEHAHPESQGARNSGLTQASMATIQGSTMDFSAETFPIDEGVMYPSTFTEGPFPPSPSRNVDDLRLPWLWPSPEFPLSADNQQAFLSNPPVLDPSGHHYPPPSTHEPPYSPRARASLMLESGGIMDHWQGDLNGFAEMPENGHSSPPPYHQNEGEASSDLLSAVQAPPFASESDQGAPVDEDPDQLRCHTCNVSFVQRQALNRHNKDKHSPRNICSLCGTFTWSSGRRYLFLRHLESHHPEEVHA